MDLQGLKKHLWNCAEVLRGSAVDRTDWKGYILPLLFFKRISDVWDEETAEALETYGDAAPTLFPEVHRFQGPENCHWRDVRETPSNVGTALARSMQEIEHANPDTLYRVFGHADWANRGKAALTELFEEARTPETPVIAERVVDDIDEVVKYVRFDGWQTTHAGEREVKMALRKTLFKYKLRQDPELFEKAYGHIREYY